MAGNWSRRETLMALAFYLCPPSPRKNWDDIDVEVQLLAQSIGRTVGAVCFKIGNLKACDPNRTGSGFSNAAKMDAQIMSEYISDPEATLSEAMYELEQSGISISYDGRIEGTGPSRPNATHTLGLERMAEVRARVHQDYFRTVLLTNYENTCCLTGIGFPELLTASHIKPWAKATQSERLMPSNGLLLNALHDRAFDRGLITLDDNYRIVVSSSVPHTPSNDHWLHSFAGRKIRLPKCNDTSIWPNLDFIHYHNDCVFEQCA